MAGTATRQQYSLKRDLHCWRIEFNRTISAVDSSFGFRFYLKSIPSLKLTRGREDYMGSLGGGLGGSPICFPAPVRLFPGSKSPFPGMSRQGGKKSMIGVDRVHGTGV